FSELLLTDYLNTHTQAPKRILLDISAQTFSNQTDDWTAYPIHRYLSEPISHEVLSFRYNAWDDYFKLLRKSAYKGMKSIGKSPNLPSLLANAIANDSLNYYRGFYVNYVKRD